MKVGRQHLFIMSKLHFFHAFNLMPWYEVLSIFYEILIQYFPIFMLWMKIGYKLCNKMFHMF